jgi:hypothetical protein
MSTHTVEALTSMLEARWYTYDSEGHCLVEHANRLSALQHAEAVIRANPKQWVRILVLDGIVSMPSKSITAGPLRQGNGSAIGNLQATANSRV